MVLQDHSRSLRAPQSFQRYDHPSRVNAVHAARPFLFTGCEDGSITQWDIETAQPVRSFVGHTQPVYGLDVHAGTLFSCSSDLTARRWTPAEYEPPVHFERDVTIQARTYQQSPRSARPGADESNVLADHGVESLMVYEGHHFGVYAVKGFEGSVYTGSLDETVREHDIETGECTKVLEVDTMVKSIVITTDGKLFTGSLGDCAAQMWDIKSNTRLRTFPAHCGDVLSIAVADDLLFTCSGFPDSSIKVWDVHSGDPLQDIGVPFVNEHLYTIQHGHTGAVKCIAAPPGGGTVFSCSEDRTVKQWDVKTGKCIRTYDGHTNEVRSICLDEFGHLYSGGADKSARQLWAYNTAAFVSVVESPKSTQ